MTDIFWVLFAYCVIERLVELAVSRRNQHAMRDRGFVESETKLGMRAMVSLHTAWYLSLCVEAIYFPRFIPEPLQLSALVVFILAQVLRFWTLGTLGRFWNISVLTNDSLDGNFVSNGPYQFIRHPNYLVVILELLSLPLVGNAPLTAALFTLANGILLSRRIPLEEQRLLKIPGYEQAMGCKGRFFPSFFLARHR